MHREGFPAIICFCPGIRDRNGSSGDICERENSLVNKSCSTGYFSGMPVYAEYRLTSFHYCNTSDASIINLPSLSNPADKIMAEGVSQNDMEFPTVPATKMVDDTMNAHVMVMREDNNDSSCRLYSLSLDSPITVQIPSTHAFDNSLEELKDWIWKNHAQQILQSMRLEHVISHNSSESYGTSHLNNNRNDLINEAEEKEEETKGSRIHRRQLPLYYKKNRGAAVGRILPNNRENLLDTIAHVQRQFFQSVAPREVFGGLLEGLLDLMSSEYGFIGEIKYEEDGTMYLQTHAITNIAWNQATRQFFDENIESGMYTQSFG
jgi:hypothetical protein